MRRVVSILGLAGVIILTTGCGSNNEGKIVGKWKMVSAPGKEQELAKLQEQHAYFFYEFHADGSVNAGLASEDSPGHHLTVGAGQYELGMWDTVVLSGLVNEQTGEVLVGDGSKERLKITIDGDNMTITASDGAAQFVRIASEPKAEEPKPEPPANAENPQPAKTPEPQPNSKAKN